MPEPLWISLMALLYFTNLTTCSAISDAFDSVSHDRLTRMLRVPGRGTYSSIWRCAPCSPWPAAISSWMIRW